MQPSRSQSCQPAARLTGAGVSPRCPDDACVIGGGLVTHHAVQRAGLDFFHEPDFLVAFRERLQREPVAETDPGEVLVGEQDRHAPARAAPGEDHLGIGDAGDVGTGLWRWQRVAGLGAVADRLGGFLVEPGPPAAAEDGAGLGAGALGQDARLASVGRPPSVAEGVFDPGTLPVKVWIAVLARFHDRMVASTPPADRSPPRSGSGLGLHALAVTPLKQEFGSRLEALGAEHLEAKGVGEPVGRIERGADRQRVLDLLA